VAGNGPLADLIASFYDASMEPRQWPAVLHQVCEVFDAAACALASHDYETGYGKLEHAVNIDAIYLTAYADVYSKYNIWLNEKDPFATAGAVFTGQEIVPDSSLLENDFYKYWLYPQGLFHHLFGVLEADAQKVSYILLARAPTKGAFWQQDTALLQDLAPSLARAVRSGQGFRRTMDLQRILLESLDAMPLGVIVLSARGRILTANRFARELIDDEDCFHIGKTGLGLKLSQGKFRFRDLLGGNKPTLSPASDLQTFTVPRGKERRPLSILLSPVKDVGTGRGPDDPAGLMFVGDPERPVEIDPRQLIRIFGLSRAEARVAVLLARGMRLDQVAATLSLTYETVRKHVKQILSKTGADRQAELVRTINLGPSGLRL
jgi:DNA-binding CsgD family transcriptional regulator